MTSPLTGWLPGLLFGLGTMLMLVVIGALFGVSLHWIKSLSPQEIRVIGAKTGGRTLFYGGILFAAFGVLNLVRPAGVLPLESGYILISLFVFLVAIPAFAYSYREVIRARVRQGEKPFP